MRISEKVQNALNKHLPVVALESTIITHGMPYPKNVETAMLVEKEISDNGATPATIGILNGEVVVGLSEAEIEELAKDKSVVKVALRDIPFALAKGLSGGTTVSATSFIAEKAGIKVFATGGSGGVHREVNETFDISWHLETLSKVNIILVSSGVKSILDVEKTFEYFETKGVAVVGYKTNEFPTFYSRKSGLKIESADEALISKMFKTKNELNIDGAILVANPIPEEFEVPYEKMEGWISQALNEMHEKGIKGKEVTPFLLARIFELSGGESLEANIALVRNNARVAALIAKELAKSGLD
jgi:pseudouridine-5'-phosphate glycosidase